jgi:hypothetical protein
MFRNQLHCNSLDICIIWLLSRSRYIPVSSSHIFLCIRTINRYTNSITKTHSVYTFATNTYTHDFEINYISWSMRRYNTTRHQTTAVHLHLKQNVYEPQCTTWSVCVYIVDSSSKTLALLKKTMLYVTPTVTDVRGNSKVPERHRTMGPVTRA